MLSALTKNQVAIFSGALTACIPWRSWRSLLIANFTSSKLASIIRTSFTPRKNIFVFSLPYDFIRIISSFFSMILSLLIVLRWSIVMVFFCMCLLRGLRLFLTPWVCTYKKNKKILMPPWWVYKNHGERSDLRPARFLCVSPCKRFDCVGAVLTSENHTLPLTAVLFAHFIRCLLSYSETG